MTTLQIAALVAVMAVVTFLTRALPFLLFGRGGEPPKVVLYLGRFLPPAVIAMLIVYCYRGTSFAEVSGWAPGFIAGAAVVLLHVWKRNNMLSIVGGTILYMVLVQAVF
ncbi:MAG: branched-chain amino acid transporter AzlD [Oscillospiraceae bacterium]|nr:branched-chain amino acid transporter AzlD [Oscillospiraceae bacterium]